MGASPLEQLSSGRFGTRSPDPGGRPPPPPILSEVEFIGNLPKSAKMDLHYGFFVWPGSIGGGSAIQMN